MFADSVQSFENRAHARGDVVIVYKDYYIEAKEAIYDKKSSTIELKGDVSVTKGVSYTILGDYAIFDLKNEKFYSKPFFFIDLSDGLWISSCESEGQRGFFELNKALVSSCDPSDPDWKLEFTFGDFNEKRKWINLYNVRLYAGSIPILYTPYLGFSTSKQRRSGLLIPKFSISNKDGFVYIQPIYLAIDPQWDLQIDPQIRTMRGNGLYATFRFVDSPYSEGYFRAGFFKEKSSYVQEQNLNVARHKGYEIFYKREKLFSDKKSGEDGLYLDFKYLSDIDYLNLQQSTLEKSYKSLVTSRFNYYYNLSEHYFGLYAKYFIDTKKLNNEDTLQILPKMQYHRYTSSFMFLENLIYSIDYKYSNFHRNVGITAQQHEINVPVGLYFSLLGDYLGFGVSENFYISYVDYSNTPSWTENATIIRNYHKFSIFSDLIKGYDSFLHTLHLNGSLIVPSYEKDRGEIVDFVTVNSETKRLELSLKEYFYDYDGKELLYHRMIQPIFYDREYKYGDLENEIGIKLLPGVNFVTDLFHSHEYSSLSSITSSLRYADSLSALSISHFYKNGFEGKSDSNFLTFYFQRNLSKKYKLFGRIDYDINNAYTRKWESGWFFSKKCWKYRVSYKEEIIPILTSAGSSSIKNRALMFKIELVPLGGIEYAFRQRDEITINE